MFGAGNADADLMFIGEAPGANEDRMGLPFVGQAGKLLDKLLAEIGLERKDVFVANVLKCRPPDNRDPHPNEIEACNDYLRRQVVTARNVRPSPLLDFWFIGLNYQIEHHLFPTLPRNKLGAARVIVRRFCGERDIPYAEVGFVQSWVEILRGLAVAAEGASEREPTPSLWT